MKKLLICMLALALLAGCAPASVQEPEDGKLHIVATVFPAYDFARATAGDLADVELLLPPGTESHSYEPTPADILKVQSCDLFLYLGGDSDQWVETILEAAEPTGRTLALIDCVETLEEEHVEGMQEEVGHHHDEDEDDHDHDHDHLGTVTEIDEHVWTAPANAAAITRQFGEVLAELDSANGEQYRANAEKYAEEIDTLDGEFHAFFDSLPDRTIVFGDRFRRDHCFSDGQGTGGRDFDGLVYRVFQSSGGGCHRRGGGGGDRYVPHLPQRFPGGIGEGRDVCDAHAGESGTSAGAFERKVRKSA